ncbi:MAG: hypothetical protein U0521_01745 [Anaerolineae bacterium]
MSSVVRRRLRGVPMPARNSAANRISPAAAPSVGRLLSPRRMPAATSATTSAPPTSSGFRLSAPPV